MEIVSHFVRLEEGELDFHVERVLMRLFQLDPESWLGFWEARIQREATKDQGERYWAVPFHLSAESGYVAASPHRTNVLGRLLEWSSRKDYAFSHSGASLFRLYTGGSPDTVNDVLEELLTSGELEKWRTVATVLHEMGYSPYFLEKAKVLLSLTDDDIVRAHLSDAIGSVGMVSGSFVPVYERRQADLQTWIDSAATPVPAKVFARQQVARLEKTAELHAADDWEDRN